MPLTTKMLGVHVFFAMTVADFELIFLGVFNKTVITLVLVGYEIVIANYHLISNTHGIIVKCPSLWINWPLLPIMILRDLHLLILWLFHQLYSVLSVRLREGYSIQDVSIAKGKVYMK